MRNLLLISILILTFCICSFAQTNATTPCPTVSLSLTGPDSFPRANEPQIFSASVGEDAKNYKIEYKWSIQNGEIVEGQGTSTIKVLQRDDDIGNILTATVELLGLPKGCERSESATAAICDCGATPILFEEFSKPVSQIDKAILNAFLIELENNPIARGYIIEYFSEGTSRKLLKQKVQKLENYLFEIKGFEKDRIVILTDIQTGDENTTRLYIVPAGVTPPIP